MSSARPITPGPSAPPPGAGRVPAARPPCASLSHGPAGEPLPADRETLPGDKNRAKCSGSAHPGVRTPCRRFATAVQRVPPVSPTKTPRLSGIVSIRCQARRTDLQGSATFQSRVGARAAAPVATSECRATYVRVGDDVRSLTSNAELGMQSAEFVQSLVTSSPTQAVFPSPFAQRGEKVAAGRMRGAATCADADTPHPNPLPSSEEGRGRRTSKQRNLLTPALSPDGGEGEVIQHRRHPRDSRAGT